MANFNITINNQVVPDFYVEEVPVIVSDCSSYYEYIIYGTDLDNIDISLVGDHESEVYVLNGVDTPFVDSATGIIYDTSLSLHFILQNSGQPGIFPKTTLNIVNNTEVDTFTTTVQRFNDDVKCGANANFQIGADTGSDVNVILGDLVEITGATPISTTVSKTATTINLNIDLDDVIPDRDLFNTGYINFDTTYVPTGTELPGTLFWNDTDETLDLIRNGTTLQLGQELYIRARNTTGVLIPNGTVVYTSGHTGIYPDISPAQGNSEPTGNIIGITTEDIANSAFGAVTTFGYVRGLKTNYTGTGDWGTTWVEGDKLWLSKDIPGGITNIEPDAPHHSDEVGVVGVVHVTQGTILVGINRHKRLKQLSDVNGTPLDTNGQLTVWDNDLQLFDFTHNINDYFLTENTKSFKETVSTGIVSGGELSINADNTKFDIAAGIGYIVDNSAYPANVIEVSFGPFTAQTLTNLATSFATDIAIDVNGNVVQQDSFTDSQRRGLIFLGGIDHSNQVNILSTFSIQVPITAPANSISELARAVGDINIFGNVYGPNGANLNIDKSGGLVFSYGRNNVNDKSDPHKITESPQVVVSFGYVFNDGSGNGSFTIPGTSINPNNYDLGTGALGAVPVNDWSIQRILFFPNDDKTFVQYGTATYNKKEDALNAVPRADFPALSGIATAMVRGYLIVREGETDLTSTNTVFLSADKFGNVAGLDGGGSLVAWGNIIGTLSDQLDLQDALDLKEDAFSKNTAFNKNFGTIAGTVAEGNDSRILNGQTAFSWGNHALAGYELIANKGVANGYAPLDAGNKLPTAYLPNLAITSVISAAESTLNTFAAASGSYTFEEGDVIVITTIGGDTEHYMYDGGTKTLTASYSLINNTQIDWSQIVSIPTTISGFGITDAYTKTESDNKYLLNTTDTFTGTLTVDGVTITESIEFSSLNPFVLGNTNTGILSIASDSSILVGSGIQLYGSTHATGANDIKFISDSTEVGMWNDSINTWNFAGDVDGNFIGTWDGVGSLQFLRSDTDDTMNGRLTITDTNFQLLSLIRPSAANVQIFIQNSAQSAYLGMGTDLALRFGTDTNSQLNAKLLTEVNFGKVQIDALNIDAGTLDSIDSTQFLRSDVTDYRTSGFTVYNDNTEIHLGSGNDMRFVHDGTNTYARMFNGDFIISDGNTPRFIFSRATGNFDTTGSGYFKNELTHGFTDTSTSGIIQRTISANPILEFQRWTGTANNFRGNRFYKDATDNFYLQFATSNPTASQAWNTKFTWNNSGDFTNTGIITSQGTGNSSFAGNVGVGIASPITNFHVLGTSTGRAWSANASTVATFENNVSGRSFVSIIAGITGQSELWFGDTDLENRGRVRYNHATDEISLWSASTQNLTIFSNSNTAIGGTTDNGYKLDVSGTGRFTDKLYSDDNLIFPTISNASKINLYGMDTRYAIGLRTVNTFGGLTSFAITNVMNNDNGRGFWWGDDGHTTAQGAMALTTNGNLTVASRIRVGYGESDTTTPNTYALDVSGTGRFTGDVTVPDEAYGAGWNGSTEVPTKNAVYDQIRPYKTYVALISQSGTSAPTATVLENNLGGTVVWSRTSTGVYVGTLTGAFTLLKTSCSATGTGNTGVNLTMARTSSNTVGLISTTGTVLGDNLLSGSSIEIRVYP